jgi:drug/metabolite transporter (DMT)-like permease
LEAAGISMLYFCLIFLLTFLGSLAALFLKKASESKNVKTLILNVNFYIGGALYCGAAIINIYVLRYLNYSTVLPLTSLTYIWTMIVSRSVLKEKLNPKKIVGVIGILIGAILIA